MLKLYKKVFDIFNISTALQRKLLFRLVIICVVASTIAANKLNLGAGLKSTDVFPYQIAATIIFIATWLIYMLLSRHSIGLLLFSAGYWGLTSAAIIICLVSFYFKRINNVIFILYLLFIPQLYGLNWFSWHIINVQLAAIAVSIIILLLNIILIKKADK